MKTLAIERFMRRLQSTNAHFFVFGALFWQCAPQSLPIRDKRKAVFVALKEEG